MIIRAIHVEEQDYRTGLALLKQSADSADQDAPQGTYTHGMAMAGDLANFKLDRPSMTRENTRAFSYIDKSANLGYYKAQFRMGLVYGWWLLNCSKDLAKSFHCYHLPVRRGSVEAAEALSVWFYHGAEGPFLPDPELSFKFAQWGAVKGKFGVEYILGHPYETARYVEKVLNEARKWYELATSHASSYASPKT